MTREGNLDNSGAVHNPKQAIRKGGFTGGVFQAVSESLATLYVEDLKEIARPECSIISCDKMEFKGNFYVDMHLSKMV